MAACLVVVKGAHSGIQMPLDDARPNRIGRGLDCQVILTDPLSSRVHAVVERRRDGHWWVRDAGSRNGTFVNGQKVDEARLAEGAELAIGSSRFLFREQPADSLAVSDPSVTQTIVQDAVVDPHDTGVVTAAAALADPERAEALLTLHQLTVKLLGCADPDEVVRISLDLLRERTGAAVAGFLWLTDDGQFRPKWVIPEAAADRVRLSGTLTRKVKNEGRAIWVANHAAADATQSLRRFADAICAPLRAEGRTLGAVHLYRDRSQFRQSDFEMTMSLANILVTALVRSRRQAALAAERRRLADRSADVDELIGESPAMRALKKKIARVARATGCVLVRGESGSGKELVARAIHRASLRADRPLLAVNCAAIPRDLMESQLFGHKKGAFTGADADHAGWFQQADTGTLFLDEVGELTLEGQAKLLRILEGHPFLPVGATREVSVDVRVIAATNRDLREFVEEGRFREDLFYRLSVFELYVPPLRERGQDIERLADHFLEHFKRQHGRPNLRLSEEARQRLLQHRWPGNVRQLRNVIDSAVVMAEGEVIEPDDLGLHERAAGRLESLRFDHWERKLIQEALQRTGGNVPAAARLLGIGRATLYRKIDEYGIQR